MNVSPWLCKGRLKSGRPCKKRLADVTVLAGTVIIHCPRCHAPNILTGDPAGGQPALFQPHSTSACTPGPCPAF